MAAGLGMQDYGNLPVYDTAGNKIGKAGSLPKKAADGKEAVAAGTPTTTFSAIEALDSLLATLSAGGTDEQKLLTQARGEEVSRVRNQQDAYSKDAAMADSQSLINKAIADAMRAAEPRITSYAEGAGASKSSMAALLSQEAATKGAVEGAALGTQLSSAYGQIFNQLESILENITKQDPNSPTGMLLQAIIGSRGIIEPQRPVVMSASSGKTENAAAPVAAPAGQPIASSPGTAFPYFTDYSAPRNEPTRTPSAVTGGGIIVTHAFDPTEPAASDGIIDSADFSIADEEY